MNFFSFFTSYRVFIFVKMEFSEFLQRLHLAHTDHDKTSLESWLILKNFLKKNIIQSILYTTDILNNTDIKIPIKCLAMILFKTVFASADAKIDDPIPHDVFTRFYSTLLSLFEIPNLQIVSISASIVFYLSSSEIKDDSSIPLISQFVECLNKSNNLYSIYAYTSILLDLCKEFTLPVEDIYSIVSGIFGHLSSGTLPPEVSCRMISLFRTIIPTFPTEFIASDTFKKMLEMLLNLTYIQEVKVEAIITWSEIIFSCTILQENVLNVIADLILKEMLNSEETLVLLSSCVFWCDVIVALSGRSELIVGYTETLFNSLFRILCFRSSPCLELEFEDLQETAKSTLEDFVYSTRATSPLFLHDVISNHSDNPDPLVQNSLLIFARTLCKVNRSVDKDQYLAYLSNALTINAPVVLFQSIRYFRALFSVFKDDRLMSLARFIPIIFKYIGSDAPIRSEIALLFAHIVLNDSLGYTRQCCEVLLEYCVCQNLEVSSSAFHAISNIGRSENVDTLMFIVSKLLDILASSDVDSINIATDVCVSLIPYISSLKHNFQAFVEPSVRLLYEIAPRTTRALQTLAYLGCYFKQPIESNLGMFLDLLIRALDHDQSDIDFSSAAKSVFLVIQNFDVGQYLELIIQRITECIINSNRSLLTIVDAIECFLDIRSIGAASASLIVHSLPNFINSFNNCFEECVEHKIGHIAMRFIDIAIAILRDEPSESTLLTGFELIDHISSVIQLSDYNTTLSTIEYISLASELYSTQVKELLDRFSNVREVLTQSATFTEPETAAVLCSKLGIPVISSF